METREFVRAVWMHELKKLDSILIPQIKKNASPKIRGEVTAVKLAKRCISLKKNRLNTYESSFQFFQNGQPITDKITTILI